MSNPSNQSNSGQSKICIIVGASHAGSQAAISLRQAGFEGRVILMGEENALPYHRPPLSKEYLAGQKPLDDILLRPQETYENAKIEIKLGWRVDAIHREQKSLSVTDLKTGRGEELGYDHLILATGARERLLPIDGADGPCVFYLRTAEQAVAICDHIKAGNRAVIIGGGYIGLEVAASLRQQKMDVTVLEAESRILQRVTAPVMSRFYKRVHEQEGVVIEENVMAQKITHKSGGMVVECGQKNFPADMVIIGIGVLPNSALAADAGVKTDNGIVVNEFCQTTDPSLYAIGDVSWHYNCFYDRELRLESVPNATEQAKIAALHIVGKPKAYKALPWFWSDQFDLKLQMAGLSEGHDEVVLRGDPEAGRSFAAFYFKDGQLLAVDAVNDPRSFMAAKMVLTAGNNLDPALVGDVDSDLKQAIIRTAR